MKRQILHGRYDSDRQYGDGYPHTCYRQHRDYRRRIMERDGYRCQICGCGVGDVCNLHWAPVKQLDVAHIVPWAQSHDSSLANVRVLCHPCNLREGHGTAGRDIAAAVV